MKLCFSRQAISPSVFATNSAFSPQQFQRSNYLSIARSVRQSTQVTGGSILGMAVWPSSAFTYGIYRMDKRPWTLPLAALFHVSVPDWHSEWRSKQVNPPPYGRTA